MAVKIFRINYKSDFILTLNSDAGWATPFCIKFWTGAPSRAYFVGYDGTTYTHCAPVEGEPTKLVVQFDDHNLPIGNLQFQIAYHFTVNDFPNDTEDEVINPASIIIEIDGEQFQVMLDFTGETAPDIEFSLPAYANEVQRIANEEQRIENEQQRITNEEGRIAEFAILKADAIAATGAANEAATLANEKAQLAADKAALAQTAATLADDKAALAQQKSVYAQTQGDYAKAQGDYAKAQGDTALADHERAEADHEQAASDHTTAAADHTQAGQDHTTAAEDHITAGNDHTRAESDHTRAESDHAAVEVYVDSLGAFDISSYNAIGGVLAKYSDLAAALGTNGANIPDALRKGGMSVKFVQSSDNKYVQYRYKLQYENTTAGNKNFANIDNWQINNNEIFGKTADRDFGYFSDNNGVIERNTHVSIKCGVLSVKEGDLICLQNKGSFDALAWYITDGSDNIIKSAPTYADYTSTPLYLRIYSGESKLYFNCFAVDGVYGNVVKYSDFSKYLSTLEETLPLYKTFSGNLGAGWRVYILNVDLLKGHIYKITIDGTAMSAIFGVNIVLPDSSTYKAFVSKTTNIVTASFVADANYSNLTLKGYSNGTGAASIILEDITAKQLTTDVDGIKSTLSKSRFAGETTDIALGYYANNNGVIQRNVHASIKCGVFSVAANDLIYLQTKGGDDSALAWFAADDAGNIKRSSIKGANYTNKPTFLRIEDGETKLYFNVYAVDGVYGTIAKYDAVMFPFATGDFIGFESGGYYTISGTNENPGTVSKVTHATYRCAYSSCKKGDIFYLNNSGGLAPRAWIVTDASGNVLSNAESYISYRDRPTIFTVEDSNAAFIYFSDGLVNSSFGWVFKSSDSILPITTVVKNEINDRKGNDTKQDLMNTIEFVNTNDGFKEKTNTPFIHQWQLSSPILNPILVTACLKTDQDNVFLTVRHVSDEASDFKTDENHNIMRYSFSNRDYEMKEILLPPFLYNSGYISIQAGQHLYLRDISITECSAPRVNRGNILMAAHLGYMLGYNTMPAFQMASRVGFVSCVANLRDTADGVLVCAHDDDFIASSDGQTYYISQKTYAEIEALGYNENGNDSARAFTKEEHLVTTEEFLRHCALTGMHPIFSAKKDVNYVTLHNLLVKYGFDKKDGLTYKAFSTELMLSAHTGLGDNVRYMYDLASNFDANFAAWSALELGNATKAIELMYDCTEAQVQACINAGLKVSLFDDHYRPSQSYKQWINWGITEFTTDTMISSGYNWW